MVLCAIGRHGVFSLGGWSPRFPTEFLVLRGTLDPGRLLVAFVYGALTLSRLPFQVILLATRTVWALPSSLAATVGISFDFSSSGYLDVSVHRVPSLSGDSPLRLPGFPIRKSADLYLFAVPRGLSQLIASFFGSWRQGIHHMPFVA